MKELREGNSSKSLHIPWGYQERADAVQQAVDRLVWENGKHALDLAGADEILGRVGLKRHDVTEARLERACRAAAERVRAETLNPPVTDNKNIQVAISTPAPAGAQEQGDQTMRVTETKAREMLVAAGKASAAECGKKVLTKMLNSLDGLRSELTEPEGEHGKLYKKVLTALGKEETVEVVADDAEESPAEKPAKKPARKAGKKPAREGKADKASGNGHAEKGKHPGVIDAIVDLLKKASARKPLAKKDITEGLARKFPDRDPDKMAKTVQAQVPGRLNTDEKRKVKVCKNDNGYWIE